MNDIQSLIIEAQNQRSEIDRLQSIIDAHHEDFTRIKQLATECTKYVNSEDEEWNSDSFRAMMEILRMVE